MDKLELTIQKIKQECKDPKIETTINGNNKWHSIIWSDESNDECFIFENNIAIHDNKIAWFQSSKNDRHL